METIKFALLTKTARIPTRNHSTDAGIDLYADMKEYNAHIRIPSQGFSVIIHTGVTVEIPKGFFGWITNKSKNDFIIGGGIVDEGYQGELLVKVINPGYEAVIISHHQPIAQLLIIPCKILDIEIADLSKIHQKKSDRGESGGIVDNAISLPTQLEFLDLKGE